MSRDLTASVQTELQATQIRPLLLLAVEFSSGTVRLWSGFGTLSWGGYSWTGAGTLLQVSPATETSELRAQGFTAVLSGIDTAYLALALNSARQGKPVTAYLGFRDATDAVIADPTIVFEGRVDGFDIDEGADTATITVRAESRLVDLTRRKIKRYTDQEQQQAYSGDLGFAFVQSLAGWEGNWGTTNLRDALRPGEHPPGYNSNDE